MHNRGRLTMASRYEWEEKISHDHEHKQQTVEQ